MKDYLTKRATALGRVSGYKYYTVVSSGNQAASLVLATQEIKAKVLLFVPASSSKIDFLCSFSHAFVFGLEDAIFEDVYERFALFAESVSGVYNANVCNEFLLSGLAPVAWQISNLKPLPTHILAGVGNGSYLAGIGWGLSKLFKEKFSVKIVPVGMQGAFPASEAIKEGKLIHEYKKFKVPEEKIDAAEGSIAIGSYSMPQLVHAVWLSEGFPLGDLTNEDLAEAYRVLSRDEDLLNQGAIPEPTGIMGLAAAIKYRRKFQQQDILLLSFTGHAAKDLPSILRITDKEVGEKIFSLAKKSRPDLVVQGKGFPRGQFYLLSKKTGQKEAQEITREILRKEGNS